MLELQQNYVFATGVTLSRHCHIEATAIQQFLKAKRISIRKDIVFMWKSCPHNVYFYSYPHKVKATPIIS